MRRELMTASLAPSLVAKIFHALAIDAARQPETPLVIVAQHEAQVIWANFGAVHLLGTANAEEISHLLFESGPSARSFAGRLSHLSPGQGPTLERLRVSRDWPGMRETIACRTLADIGPEPLVALQFQTSSVYGRQGDDPLASALENESEPPSQKAAASPPQPPAPAASTGSRGHILRVLWETDGTGCLTEIGPAFQHLMGRAALSIGDHLPTRIRAFAPDLGDRLEASVRDNSPIETSRVNWPHAASGAAVPVEIGCAHKRGRAAGLRGFCTLHVDDAMTLPTSSPAFEPELVPSTTLAQPANDDAPSRMERRQPR